MAESYFFQLVESWWRYAFKDGSMEHDVWSLLGVEEDIAVVVFYSADVFIYEAERVCSYC